MSANPQGDVSTGLRDTLTIGDARFVFDLRQNQYSELTYDDVARLKSDGDFLAAAFVASTQLPPHGVGVETSNVTDPAFQPAFATGHATVVIDDNSLNIAINAGASLSQVQLQLPDWSSGNAGRPAPDDIWSNGQVHSHNTFSPAADNDTGSAYQTEAFAGYAADARGNGGGGTHGGGGGGSGGGSGLLTTYTSGDPNIDNASEFNIQINFGGKWTVEQQAIVKWAADTWTQIITADIRDDFDLNGKLVDDIVISVSTGRIDGNGNPLSGDILAQTGDIVVRDAGTIDQWLPLTASITLDSTDLRNSAYADAWDDIILHEMGHALGFIGAIFGELGLADGSGNFTGTNAVAAYGGLVPLENGGGSGTAGSHWDETSFMPNGEQMYNELMTGYFVPGEQTYLSDTTVGAFADLGYTVQDPSAGTSYLVVGGNLVVA